MSSQTLDRRKLVAELAKKTGNEEVDAEEEIQHVAQLLFGPLDELIAKKYGDFRVEGIGGSGIVLSAVYQDFGTRRAIKLPRKRTYDDAKSPDSIAAVDPEIHALSKLSHENITRLYAAYPLPERRGYCTVTEYVEQARPLDQFATALCCDTASRKTEATRETRLLTLARTILSVVRAIEYMHVDARLLHFDIKPDNVLVDGNGRAFITDLGFARDLTKYGKDDEVQVGFTWKYAHKRLTNPDDGARVSKSPNKSKNKMKGAALSEVFDIFALGRTLQEVLKKLENVYRGAIYSHYTYNYLHFVAALCLDGKNVADAGEPSRDFIDDQPLRLPIQIFQQYKFPRITEVREALERLLGLYRLEEFLPELDRWTSQTVRVSGLGSTTFTERVKTIVEHPLFQRLGDERQLGMLDTVFPTATHTRLEHSLGVYHNAREYIAALYYDPENPTFRVLFSERKCRVALLASLVHDLGQTTFGHELEEVDEDQFSHEQIGLTLIKESTVKGGRRKRTLKDLIEGKDHYCWDLTVDELELFLRSKTLDPVSSVLHDVLDSQIDADKLDYLTRDTAETRVQYGFGIDHDRLLRSLTTCSPRSGEAPFLRLAVKRKGAAAAEAFAFARYQLYQALYWHHTFRAVKAMLLTAASEVTTSLDSPDIIRGLGDDEVLRREYLASVFDLPAGIAIPMTTLAKGEKPTLGRFLRQKLTTSAAPRGNSRFERDRAIQFFWRLSEGKAQQLIRDLLDRRYYKRVIEIPLTDFSDEGWVKLREIFSGKKRVTLRKNIEDNLLNALQKSIQDQMTDRMSLQEDEALKFLKERSSARFAFLVDLPVRGWTATGAEPVFVSDYKRRHFRTSAGAFDEFERSTLWSDTVPQLMRRIAVVRVFAEPGIHSLLLRVLSSDVVRSAVTAELPGLKTT